MNGSKDSEAGKQIELERLTVSDRLRQIPAIGIIFALLSAIFIPTGNLVVKLVDEYHAIEIAVIGSLIQVVFYSMFILLSRTSLRPAKGENFVLILRCVFGFISIMCSYLSLRMIPMGDSTAIIYSAPVIIAVIARIFLKEKCDIVNVIALFITASGVVLITKPMFLFPDEDAIEEEHRLVGCLVAVSSAFGAACAFVSIRKLQNTPSSVVIFWHSLFSVVFGTIVLVSINELKMVYGLRNILLLLAMGLFGALGQLCLTLAFKLEEAGPVSLSRTVSIVIAFIYQVFLLNEEHEWSSFVGASIVLLSVVSVGLRKWYLVRQKKKMRSSETSSVEINVDSISEICEKEAKCEIKNEINVINNVKY